ncbi:MAG TPA: hypothetical protein DFR83_23360, partial [Deltaproteobacteria bacterium]|nr:hypothetical protein [Deltaproteobacteria bacterium]
GYQGATERAFMVSTRAGRVDRYDSNGSLLQLFDSLNQVEKMLFYLGVLGYVPRCETVEQDAAGVWRIEVDVVTSECPYITQHQSVQIHPNGTLHTLEVLQTERGPDCPRGAE